LKRVRLQLNLRQEELATLLGCSRSAIAMAERSERELPPNAQSRLTGLVVQSVAPMKSTDPTLAVDSSAMRDQDQVRMQLVQKLELKKIALERQLMDLEERWTVLGTAWEKLNHILKAALQDQDSRTEVAARSAIARCKKPLVACSPARQLGLESRLVGVKAQINFLKWKTGAGTRT